MPITLHRVIFESRIGVHVEIFASHNQYHGLFINERTPPLSGTLHTIDVRYREGRTSYHLFRYPDVALLVEGASPYTIHQHYSDGLLVLTIRDRRGATAIELAPTR